MIKPETSILKTLRCLKFQFPISVWPDHVKTRSIQQYNVCFFGLRNGSVVHLIRHRTANQNIWSSIHRRGRTFFFSINVNANHWNMFLYQIGLIFYIFYLIDNLPLFVLTHSRHKVMTISLMLGKNMISFNIQTGFFLQELFAWGRSNMISHFFLPLPPYPLPPPSSHWRRFISWFF